MKIFLPFHGTGANFMGVGTFAQKFKKGMEAIGHEVFFEYRPDYDVLFCIVQAPFRFLFDAQRKRKPIIQRLDGVYYWSVASWKYPLLNLKARIIRHFFADYTIYQSEFSRYSADHFLGQKRNDPSSIIYNGVDLQLFSPIGKTLDLRDNPDQKIFFSASSFRRKDQVIPLLAAVDAFQRRYSTNVKLVLAGPFRAEVKDIPQQLAKKKHVSFLGNIPNEDLPQYERSADLFLFSHLNPPCPNNILESLASGLPVCGIADGAMPELITQGNEGLLLPVKGDAFWKRRPIDGNRFADNMHHLLLKQDYFSQSSRARAERDFDLRNMTKKYAAVFTELSKKQPYQIGLFQPKLRKFVLDIGSYLKNFRFVSDTNAQFASTKTFYKTRPSSFEKEVSRVKITPFQRLRRLLPLPNIRIRFERKNDLLFTYGCLLITNRPYAVWIENGAALHGYDPLILQNPLAKLFLLPFALDPHLKYLVFMSQASQKSFFSTLGLKNGWLRRRLERKSIQIYPCFPEPKEREVKSFSGELHCLFTGVYYMKGGRETLEAFQELRREKKNVFLTVLTPLHLLHPNDRKLLETSEGVTLLDATLQRHEMEALYKKHTLFLFPSYKDTFGLVLIEALSFGMPIIATDQYAVTEMVRNKYNGFVLPDHPFTDYDRKTFFMKGKYYDAQFFYQCLFDVQKKGKTASLKTFIKKSLLQYLAEPELVEVHSRNSYALYDAEFRESIVSKKWDDMFINTLG